MRSDRLRFPLKTNVRNWLLASRPKTLIASVAPVAIGTALAVRDQAEHWPTALLCLFGALSIQVGTNFCNDYFDFRQGADTADRKGPRRAVASGLISPSAMWWASVAMFTWAAFFSWWLVRRGGWPMAAIAALGIGLGILYTAGRRSLAYLGLGDVCVLVFFGPVAVGGTYYVQALRLPWYVLVAGLTPGLVSTGILAVNNLRDIDEDRLAGKKTLAVRFGSHFVRAEYTVMIVTSMMLPLVLGWSGILNRRAWLIAFAALPALWLIREVWRRDAESLNPLLGGTAAFLLVQSLAFILVCLLP